jgi:hypothetical protein
VEIAEVHVAEALRYRPADTGARVMALRDAAAVT